MTRIFLPSLLLSLGFCAEASQCKDYSLLQIQKLQHAVTAESADDSVSDADTGLEDSHHELLAGQGGLVPNARLFIGIKAAASGPEYSERRTMWRNSGLPELLRKNNISYAFFIGVPLSENHDLFRFNQSSVATAEERADEASLLEESQLHHDIEFVAFRDLYDDLPNKMISILKYGVERTTADYIMEQDDDFCASPAVIDKVIYRFEQRSQGEELWAGSYWFDHNGQTAGADGKLASYFSGNGHFMSRNLVKRIVEDDYDHTILNGLFGTSAEDATLGKLVEYAEAKHNITVDRVENNNILDAISF
jgi:hypothetical protein